MLTYYETKFVKDYIRKALKLGWETVDTCPGTDGISPKMLILKSHDSYKNNWCAEWTNITVDGVAYCMPHWLPEIVGQQIDRLIESLDERGSVA